MLGSVDLFSYVVAVLLYYKSSTVEYFHNNENSMKFVKFKLMPVQCTSVCSAGATAMLSELQEQKKWSNGKWHELNSNKDWISWPHKTSAFHNFLIYSKIVTWVLLKHYSAVRPNTDSWHIFFNLSDFSLTIFTIVLFFSLGFWYVFFQTHLVYLCN